MPVIRLILLVTILGGLTLLLAYNWSPALPLRFFGMTTQKLPLAIWILLGTTAGAATTLFIGSLWGLSNYFGKKSQPSRVSESQRPNYRQGEPAPRPNSSSTVREERAKETANSRNPKTVRDSSIHQQPNDEYEYDDWDLNRNADNWEFDEEEETPPPKKSKKSNNQRENTPESSSTYSYGYQEPKGSSVGKTESIYDADYRVIIPPYPSSPTETSTKQKDEDKNNTDDDDWGIFEEDDENEDQPSDKTQGKKLN